MKKILMFVLFILYSSFLYSEDIIEKIGNNSLIYDKDKYLSMISLKFSDKDLNLSYYIYCSEYDYSDPKDKIIKINFYIDVFTKELNNINVYKDLRSFSNLYNNPYEFNSEGNPISYIRVFSYEFDNLVDLMKELQKDNINISVNGNKYNIKNPYKNNKELKEKLLNLSLEFAIKHNPKQSKDYIEILLNIKEAKKFL